MCEREGWRNLRGELCVASARKPLPQLAEELPLGRGQAPACRLTYLLNAAGPLRVLSFVAAPLRLGPRDQRLGWQETLRREPERWPGSFPELVMPDDANWARREFQRSDLADGRLRERLGRMGHAGERHRGEPLTAIFPRGNGECEEFRV